MLLGQITRHRKSVSPFGFSRVKKDIIPNELMPLVEGREFRSCKKLTLGPVSSIHFSALTLYFFHKTALRVLALDIIASHDIISHSSDSRITVDMVVQ